MTPARKLAPSHPLAAERAIILIDLHDRYPELPLELLEETAYSKARNNLKRERRERNRVSR